MVGIATEVMDIDGLDDGMACEPMFTFLYPPPVLRGPPLDTPSN